MRVVNCAIAVPIRAPAKHVAGIVDPGMDARIGDQRGKPPQRHGGPGDT